MCFNPLFSLFLLFLSFPQGVCPVSLSPSPPSPHPFLPLPLYPVFHPVCPSSFVSRETQRTQQRYGPPGQSHHSLSPLRWSLEGPISIIHPFKPWFTQLRYLSKVPPKDPSSRWILGLLMVSNEPPVKELEIDGLEISHGGVNSHHKWSCKFTVQSSATVGLLPRWHWGLCQCYQVILPLK